MSNISLPKLHFNKNSLSPYISENTIDYHYGKHHATYVQKTNDLIVNTELEGKSLEEIVKISKNENNAALFNNSAQVWNHNFYWNSIAPNGGGVPKGELLDIIERDFGSFEEFVKKFKESAVTQFGSGWVWLVLEKNQLKIIKTSNAETPLSLSSDIKILLTIDVWEHAYYLDYQNARPKYIDSFIENLINWNFVKENLSI